jgi:8-oxo-dGTP pyrophosphatase MutT (NUDIX family)
VAKRPRKGAPGTRAAKATSTTRASTNKARPATKTNRPATAPDGATSKRRGRVYGEHSAGGVIMRSTNHPEQPLVLLIRDSYDNWGFPKGHIEPGEPTDHAAVREVAEETGLGGLDLRGLIDTIDWWFRFRGRLIHKVCDFYLMVVPPGSSTDTKPQRAEGISACDWVPYDAALERLSYANARAVLARAYGMMTGAQADGAQ